MEIKRVGTHHLVADDEGRRGFLRFLDHKNQALWYEAIYSGWRYVGDDESNQLEAKFASLEQKQ